jgi:hypothetical protein
LRQKLHSNLGGLNLREKRRDMYLREEHENMKMRRIKEDSEMHGTDVKCCTKKMSRSCRKGGTI